MKISELIPLLQQCNPNTLVSTLNGPTGVLSGLIHRRNPLLRTDVYKCGHMRQYAPGCNKVYSHLMARSSKNFPDTVFFGLQYYLKEYLTQPILPWHAEEFIDVTSDIIEGEVSQDVKDHVRALAKLGYWPLHIKAVKEGTIVPARNVLMTITNTLPDFYWTVGFVESLLLKVWYPTTVATTSLAYRRLLEKYWKETVDVMDALDFFVHDFGYRGDSSEEGSEISGTAHLLSFVGSDTIPAYSFARDYYRGGFRPDGTREPIMKSVPASEHSVACSFGRDQELAYFRRMLELYPSGIVSLISDTFNVYRVLTEFVQELKPMILARDGKVVFRPDSGNPEYIICGDPEADDGSLANLGALRLLENTFGSTLNAKGYKVLNQKVGLIYGDGMYLARFEKILERMKSMGFAASNLVIGVGGILRNHSRDTCGFAIKATYVEVDGVLREIEKDPITDPGKKSCKGLMRLDHDPWGKIFTRDQVTAQEEEGGMLESVFRDGEVVREQSLYEMRQLVRQYLRRS